jgi:hypothetical protein
VDGALDVHALGAVTVHGTLASRFGPLVARAGTDLFAAPASGGDAPVVRGGTVDLSAEGGDLALHDADARAVLGDFSARAGGALSVTGTVTAAGSLSLVADGSVNAAGATLATDGGVADSGSILLESRAGDAGTIDVSGGTLATGDADAASGDITLRVRAAAGTGAAGSEAHLLLVTAQGYRPAGRGFARLRLDGTVEGAASPGAAAEARLSVGTDERDLRRRGREGGRSRRFAAPGASVRLRDRGDGLLEFRLRWRGRVEDTSGSVDGVPVEFEADPLRIDATVRDE